LTYIFIPKYPERSYWEGEWLFPNTKSKVAIGLDGDESGPNPEGRDFYLGFTSKFDRIISLVRPKLADVFIERLKEALPDDIFTAVKLSGFGVDNPASSPLEWSIDFETIGVKWLGISIPFIDETPQNARVDT